MGKLKEQERFIRHGDVYLVESALDPADVRRRGRRVLSPVIAEGEVTGHKHVLVADTDTSAAWERYEVDGKMVLIATEDGLLIEHQEHGALAIPPRVYEERIDREYDYSAGAIRRVAD